MAILHKNITVSSDIHNPKWLPDANNGDYAFKNEKGELESIDELLLPAALNFVDGSVAPPTTTTGDIYILSSGGSVNAGWGSVALQDWVRYDGTAWNSLTPQKSSLCYDKTADSLMSFDGSAWAAIGGGGGGNTIYTADDSLTGNRTVDLNSNTLKFENGQTYVDNGSFNPLVINRKGSGTLGNGVDFNAYNSSNVETNFARIVQVATDATAGSEDGGLWFRTVIAGTLRTPVILDNREFLIDAVNFTDNAFRVIDGGTDCLKVTTSKQTYIESGTFNPLVINRKASGVNGVGFDLNAYNSSNAEHNFARIVQVATDITAGSEDGALWLRVSDNGTITTKVKIETATTEFSNEGVFTKKAKVYGLDTLSTSTAFQIYDGDGTPNLLVDFKNSGNVDINANWRANEGTLKINSNNQSFVGVGLTDTTNGYYGGFFWRPTTDYLTIGSNASGFAIEPTANNQAYVFTNTSFTSSKELIVNNDFTLNGNQEVNANWVASKGIINLNTSNQSFNGIALTDTVTGYMGMFGYRPTNDFFVIESTSAISGISFNTNGNNRRMTITDGGVNISNLPTSASGLSSGDLYNDGGTVKIV